MKPASLSRSAAVVGIAVFASRLFGLVREATFTALFGAGRELDAFIVAFRIPNLFRDLVAEGALSAAFVSTFSRALARDGEPAAWRLASRVLTNLVLIVGTAVLVGMVGAPWIVDTIAPGFTETPGKSELTTSLTRLLFPFLLFVAAAAVAMGILNARNVFGIPASASIFFNAGSVVLGLTFAWLFAPDYVTAIVTGDAVPAGQATAALFGMAIGTLAGGALQFLVQVPALRRVGFRFRWSPGFRDPGVREVLRLMGPATIGVAAVQVNVLVNTIFASTLEDGAVSWLGVAFRLMYVPIGMVGVALGTVVLPSISRASATGDREAFRRQLGEALELLILLCLPAAVGLVVVAEPLVALIYERGLFTAADTRAAALALSAYSVGLTGYAAVKILGPAFYALEDTRTPMRVSIVSMATNLVLNWMAVAVLGLGHAGLALATSIVALSNATALAVLLRGRIGAYASGLGRFTARVAVATGVMASVAIAWRGAFGAGPLVTVATTVPLAMAVFLAAGHLLGIRRLKDPGSLLRR